MDILDEIKQDMRSEQAQKFWNVYGKLIIAAAVALVLVTAVGSGYKQYQQYRSAQDAQVFSQAIDLADAQNRDEALQKLAAISGSAGKGYQTLAIFSEASIKYKAGDKKGAADAYIQLALNTGIDLLYRDLALIYGTSIAMDLEKPDLQTLDKDLQPLTDAGRPWRFSALELQGLIAMQSGDKSKAKNIFDRIAADINAPLGLKTRATRVSSVLAY